jgi:hypothetical protein
MEMSSRRKLVGPDCVVEVNLVSCLVLNGLFGLGMFLLGGEDLL